MSKTDIEIEAEEDPFITMTQAAVGKVVSVTGAQAIVQIDNHIIGHRDGEGRAEMGSLLKIDTPSTIAIGIVSGLSAPMPSQEVTDPEIRIAEVELVGEFP